MKLAIIGIILLSVLLLGCTNPFEQKPKQENLETKTALEISDVDRFILKESDVPNGYDVKTLPEDKKGYYVNWANNLPNTPENELTKLGAKTFVEEKSFAYDPKIYKIGKMTMLLRVAVHEKPTTYFHCMIRDDLQSRSTKLDGVGNEASVFSTVYSEDNKTFSSVYGYYSNVWFIISGTNLGKEDAIKYAKIISERMKKLCPNCPPAPKECPL